MPAYRCSLFTRTFFVAFEEAIVLLSLSTIELLWTESGVGGSYAGAASSTVGVVWSLIACLIFFASFDSAFDVFSVRFRMF